MTAPATTRRAGPFNGNGVTSSFPFTFKVFATSDIAVVKTSTTGLDSTLALGSDYSVNLNADQDASPGGTITYPISGAALASGEKLTAVGAIPYDQTADLPTGGNYRAVVIENALDRGVFQVQQLAEVLGRTLTLPPSAATANTELPAPQGGKVIAWNSTGTALVNIDSSDLAAVVVAGTSYTDLFSGTGSQTAFTLSSDPGSVNALDIAISGVSQVNGVDFTVSGTTLTFTDPPPAGTNNIAVRYVAALPVGTTSAVDTVFNPTVVPPVGTAAWWMRQAGISVLRFIPTSLHAGIVAGTNNTDLSSYLQSAFNAIKQTGGALYFHGYTYKCLATLDWRRDTAGSPNTFHYAFIGDGAVLDFRDSSLTSGSAIRIGATSQSNTNEAGKIIVQGLIALGPDTGAITDSNARATTLTGFSFEFCINLVLDSLHSMAFYRGYKTNFCFPIDARSVVAQACNVGLHVGSDCTTGVWTACGFRNGRFGILMQPDTVTTACYGQTFVNPNLEGNYVGAALDPLNGSGAGIWATRFIGTYVEAVDLDAFRIGTTVNLANAGSIGADRTREVHGIVWDGGTWDAGASAWGTTNHDAIRGPTSGSTAKPYSLVINLPVPDTGMTLVGCKDITLSGYKDPTVGGTAINVHAFGGQGVVLFDATGATGTKTLRMAKNVSSVTKNGTGEFTLAFPRQYASGTSYAVSVTTHGTGVVVGKVYSQTAGGCVVRTYDMAGTLTDPTGDVSVFVVGSE